jgi:hypothetical protein
MKATAIPEKELNDYYLVVFKDENGALLFNAVHINEFNWSQDGIRFAPMDEVFKVMREPKRTG